MTTMSIQKRKTTIDIYTRPAKPDCEDLIREACALHLQPYSTHCAGGGSYYIYAGDVKIRFADHDETSRLYDPPDFNLVNEGLDDETTEDIIGMIDYPELAKKTVVAKHLGITVPKLRKLLEPYAALCYEDVCENEAYPNTYTQYVVVEEALRVASESGIPTRVPIECGVATFEDYHPYR